MGRNRGITRNETTLFPSISSQKTDYESWNQQSQKLVWWGCPMCFFVSLIEKQRTARAIDRGWRCFVEKTVWWLTQLLNSLTSPLDKIFITTCIEFFSIFLVTKNNEVVMLETPPVRERWPNSTTTSCTQVRRWPSSGGIMKVTILEKNGKLKFCIFLSWRISVSWSPKRMEVRHPPKRLSKENTLRNHTFPKRDNEILIFWNLRKRWKVKKVWGDGPVPQLTTRKDLEGLITIHIVKIPERRINYHLLSSWAFFRDHPNDSKIQHLWY